MEECSHKLLCHSDICLEELIEDLKTAVRILGVSKQDLEIRFTDSTKLFSFAVLYLRVNQHSSHCFTDNSLNALSGIGFQLLI
jgi:hypothetical protein